MAGGSIRTVRRALRVAWQASPRAFVAWVALGCVAQLSQPLLLAAGRVLVNRVAAGSATLSELLPAVAVIVLAYFVHRIAGVAAGGFLTVSQTRIVAAVGQAHVVKATQIDAERLDDSSFHDVMLRSAEAANMRVDALVNWVINGATSLFGLAVLFGVIGVVEPLVSLLAFASVVPVVIAQRKGFGIVRVASNANASLRRRFQYLQRLPMETAAGAELRATNAGPHLSAMHAEVVGEVVNAQVRSQTQQAAWTAAGNAAGLFFLGAAFALVGSSAADGRAGPGDVALLVASLNVIVSNVMYLSNGWTVVTGHIPYVADLFEFLDTPSVITAPTTPLDIPEDLNEGLRFESVSFQYPSGTAALSGVDLQIRPGELVALVGENGAGKTTLVRLLLRLYDPTLGAVRLAGVDLRDADPTRLRDRVGVIFQEFARYEMPLRDAVRMGRPDAPYDDAKVRHALSAAGLERFVASLPDGLDTQLGRAFPGGRELSGGQWQRIALARLFFRGGDVWVLDEPTAALDPEGEAAMFATLRAQLGNRLGLVISHRFSTVRIADRIVVLHEGRAVEVGTHTELVAAGGRYAHLFETQAAGYR